jgi:PAS domain S-box-containing protein
MDAPAHLSALFEQAAAQASFEPTRFDLVIFNSAFARRIQEIHAVDLREGMPLDELLPAEAAAQWREWLARAGRTGSLRAEYAPADASPMLLTFARLARGATTIGLSVLVSDRADSSRIQVALAELRSQLGALMTSARRAGPPPGPAREGGSGEDAAAVAPGVRMLVEVAPVPIAVVRGRRVEYVNAAYARVFRTSAEALCGVPMAEHWAAEFQASVAAQLFGAEAEGEAFEHEGLGVHPDGTRFPMHASVVSLRDGAEAVQVAFLTDMTERRAMETQLHETLDELRQLWDRLQQDNLALRQQITVQQSPSAILGQSPVILQVIEQAKAVAPTDSVVLITGETGTGKELLARAIHEASLRAEAPLVTVNCAALPAGLIESELFGREKGAYTGASTRQQGRFESAHGATLFLDEVAELPFEVQAKLLRVLQDGRFERLGSAETVSVNVRVIAATNHDLGDMVEAGRFRADLFYRLRVFPIEMPPLRARAQDIPLLVWDAARFFGAKLGKTIDVISWQTMQELQQRAWPGNVRELRNVIERAVILSPGRTLSVTFEPEDMPVATPVTLADAQRRHVVAILEQTGWRIGGKDGAAARLGLQRSTLNSLMKRLGIIRPATRGSTPSPYAPGLDADVSS